VYKAVLIGLGNIAWKLGRDSVSGASLSHRDAFDQNHKVELIAGYSPEQEEIQCFESESELAGYSDISQMFEEVRPDIVSICSPQAFHSEQVALCFKYKVPMVWLEKPAATRACDAMELDESRKQMLKPSVVLVNFQRRYTESYQKLRQLIQQKEYGSLLAVEVHYSRGLMLNGSHMMDMLAYLFPEFEYELLWVESGEQLSNPDFIVRLSKEVIVHVCGIDSLFHNIDIRVTCEQGRLSIEHGGMTIRVEEVKENEMFPGFYRLYDKRQDDLGAGEFGHAFDWALNDLIESFEQDRQPISNLLTAVKGQKLIEKVFKFSGI
jgi:predicted dehydrogenase